MSAAYQLEQGISDPRSGGLVWTPYDQFPTLADAKREAVKGHNWRIIEMKVVWEKSK